MKIKIILIVSFLIIILLITGILKDININGKNIDIIFSYKKVSLDEFIKLYQNNKFIKIELENDINLYGYEKIKSEKELIKSLTFQNEFEITKNYYNRYETTKPANLSLKDMGILLTGNNIIVKYKQTSIIEKLIFDLIAPIVIFLLIFFLVLKTIGGGKGLPFNVSAGRQKTKEEVKTTFKDVAGMEEVKQELLEIVDYLKNPLKYKKIGARIPKGVLLYGPPGSGKTLLARAIAGEAGVPFFVASGSEFMEMLVGMGAAKVRDLFNKAKASAPSIIFIDEIDTIGRKRGLGYSGGHQEQEQTLNQILTEMDGFDKDTSVIVIAATNRPDILDPALLRPGRFDRKIYVGRPTLEERIQIIKIHLENKKHEINIEQLAKKTSGMVGADIENIINEAALKVARENRNIITNEDIEWALEKVIMGPEKKIKTIKDIEKRKIAYHELGHAFIANNLPNVEPVEKISIVSRGMALGVTWIMPKEDTYLYTKAKFLDEITVILGGRAAEEIFFGKDEITTGAANDFEKATKIAFDMVTKYGMDEELGPLHYLDIDKNQFLPFKPFSEKTNEIIDKKVKEIIEQCYKKAKEILINNQDKIHKIASILIEKEVLTKDEFENLIKE